MKPIQQQIRSQLLESQEQSTERLPKWLRNATRALSGGDEWTAQFVRGIIWKYRWLILAALLANLGAGAAEAATLAVFTLALNQMTTLLANVPTEASGMINEIVQQISQFLGGTEPLIILVVLAVLFQIARSTLDYASQSASIFLRVWLEGDLNRRIFSQLVGMRYQQVAESRIGNLASYSSQVAEIGGLVTSLNMALNDIAIMSAYAVVLFWLSWQFTIVAGIGLFLLSFGFGFLREGIRQTSAKYVNVSVRLNEQVLEYLQGLRLVHIFVREKEVIHEVNSIINSSVQSRRIGLLQRAAILPLYQSLTIIGVAIFLALGYWFMVKDDISRAGELVTYIFVIYRVMPRYAGFNAHLGLIAAQWPYVDRVAQLLNPAEKEEEYHPGKQIESLQKGIDFQDVTLRYPAAERNAVDNLTFTIPAGEMTAIVGASGSGKSSIINLLLGISRPTEGQILIDGTDLQVCDLASWRRLLGVVDQEVMLFSSTVADNIRFGRPKASDAEMIAAAKVAHADQFINELPDTYQTEVGNRGYKLSGGQRQRIAIARAVINDPSLLLFDEATSALDSLSEQLIQSSLEELRKERTVVVIAHRLSTIVKADQIIVLEHGQLLEQGTHQELLAQKGHYAAMWQLQADSGGVKEAAPEDEVVDIDEFVDNKTES